MPPEPPVFPREQSNAIAEAAALWLARRDRGLNAREAYEFRQWREADPRHAAELDRLDAAWRTCDRAGDVPDLAAMAAELDRATAGRVASRNARTTLWQTVFAAAAALTVVGGLLWSRYAPELTPPVTASPTYEVHASAAQRVVFDDGSIALTRPDSEVRAEFTATERRVVLLRGEAHFNVEKDPARPFVVSAGPAAVRAVGTAFNVKLDPERVEVIVTHGTVQVADAREPETPDHAPPPLVVAGQKAVIEHATPVNNAPHVAVAVTPVAEVENALAWQSTRLVFARTPLAEAVDAFNQHASGAGGRLVLGDPALRDRKLGGTFRASNIDGFVRLLEQSADLRVERRGDQIVLFPAR